MPVVIAAVPDCVRTARRAGKKPDDPTPPTGEVNIDNEFEKTSDILVVYFSKTNTTQSVALTIQGLTDADLFEVERKEPYPDEYTPTTEIAQEEKNANARPELKTYFPKSVVEQYDTIFVGFPIWWGTAPMPVLTFLNFYDWSGKTIYTFCTAASSGIGGSTEDIRTNAQNATVVEGRRFQRNDAAAIEAWVTSLNFNQPPIDPPELEPTQSLTYERNGNAYTVTGVSEDVEDIVIPAEHEGLPVTQIGNDAFTYARHTADILSVVIPDSVTVIGRNAFYHRSELTTVTISQGSALTAIDNNAFAGNNSLKSIFLPKGLARLGSDNEYGDPSTVFNGCGSLDTITVDRDNPVFSSEGNALIEIATHKLIRGTNNTVIPDSVTTIGSRAFSDVNIMTELVIPVSVTKIERYIISWRSTSITTIRYLGTEAQWNAVDKESSWDNDNADYRLVFGEN